MGLMSIEFWRCTDTGQAGRIVKFVDGRAVVLGSEDRLGLRPTG